MNKYCRFLQDIYDETNEVSEGKILIWKKYQDVKIILEIDDCYCFEDKTAISKKNENEVYECILKEIK